MKVYPVTLLLLLLVFASPTLTVLAQSKTPSVKTKSAPLYECPICHHKANAALAKKLHYICPVDNGKLAPIKTASVRKSH